MEIYVYYVYYMYIIISPKKEKLFNFALVVFKKTRLLLIIFLINVLPSSVNLRNR